MVTLFWLSALAIAYVYVIYPALVALLARRRPDPLDRLSVVTSDLDLPAVTVVISVYNESARIAAKLANLRALDYPADRLHIILVSDGSTDDTVARYADEPGIELIALPQRRGKPHAINTAMARVRSPVTLLMDVRQRTDPDALRQLVRTLQQPGVGACSGELTHLEPGSRTAASVGLYWRYERAIRKAESRIDSTVGTTGACYALRTELFRPIPEDFILDDFFVPMEIVRQGQRVLLHDGVPVYDELQAEIAGERTRKIRTLSGNYQAFARMGWLFDPRRNRVWLQFISHKVMRLLAPWFLLATLLASAGLAADGSPFHALAFVLQAAFYLAALAGSLSPGLRKLRLVSLATVFTQLNLAAVWGLWRHLAGQTRATWDKT
ncbi:glycosyltransferase family 2 protein [Leptothrix discophora]|uniref:Glycosyltransferase family 2 protein n=1 Tax=Leptothrix discophora TaxID=89 RepID=A0ABT9G0A8_LEPDI|nr:glycosyltransferase family 2 protein [Leptothrix discophora]MDP4299901.1 glycosyltransferase family 2 protein [Leptothrix discophora]